MPDIGCSPAGGTEVAALGGVVIVSSRHAITSSRATDLDARVMGTFVVRTRHAGRGLTPKAADRGNDPAKGKRPTEKFLATAGNVWVGQAGQLAGAAPETVGGFYGWEQYPNDRQRMA